MTGARDADATVGGSQAPGRPNYAGAIYGSLLAASVVVGAGVGAEGNYHLRPLRLAALLVATGLVFFLAHAYAELVGDRVRHASLGWPEVRRVARHEWPLFQASLPPAGAAVVVGLLGASDTAAAWTALVVALVAQVGWATFATRRSGASAPLVLATAAVNLVLGLLIVALKTALQH